MREFTPLERSIVTVAVRQYLAAMRRRYKNRRIRYQSVLDHVVITQRLLRRLESDNET